MNQNPYQLTNKGISIALRLQQYQGEYIASIDCPYDAQHFLGSTFGAIHQMLSSIVGSDPTNYVLCEILDVVKYTMFSLSHQATSSPPRFSLT